MADEPVVVSKARPMKASNGAEGKTKPTISNKFDGGDMCQKPYYLRRGEACFKIVMSNRFFFSWIHKLSDQQETLS